ncbi:MAG: hypothetical protein ACEQSA_04480 [Weeksellaceae bacterium]
MSETQYKKPQLLSYEPQSKPFGGGAESDVYETVPALSQDASFQDKFRHYLETKGLLKPEEKPDFLVKVAKHSGFFDPFLKGDISPEISSQYEEMYDQDTATMQRIFGDAYVPATYLSWHHFKDGKARIIQKQIKGDSLANLETNRSYEERLQKDPEFRSQIEKLVTNAFETFAETGFFPDLSFANLIQEEGTGKIYFIDTFAPSLYREVFHKGNPIQKYTLASHIQGFYERGLIGNFLPHIDTYKAPEMLLPNLFRSAGKSQDFAWNLSTRVNDKLAEYEHYYKTHTHLKDSSQKASEMMNDPKAVTQKYEPSV